MNVKIKALLIATTILILAPATVILATGPYYVGQLGVTNTGAAADNVYSVFDLNTQNLIDGDMMADDALDVSMKTADGKEVAVMPGVDGNPWAFHIPHIGHNAQEYYYLYTGEATDGIIRYFSGANGMSVSDDPIGTLELGSNFTVKIEGFIKTNNFPIIADVNGGNDVVNQTDHTVNLPDNINAGDLLIVIFADDGGAAITFPGGWTMLTSELGGATMGCNIYYRIADGTETSTITVTTGVSSQMTAHTSYRITNYTGVPEAVDANGSSANPDPPNIAPTWGAHERTNLWLSVCAYDSNRIVTAYPANYSDGRNDYANNGEGCGVGSAWRDAYGISENPGTFTISGADEWTSATIAIVNNGSLISKASAFGIYVSGDEAISATITGGATVTATGVDDDEHNIVATADGANISIYVDTILADGPDPIGASVPNNGSPWYSAKGMPYFHYQEITTSGTPRQHIEWEYDTTFHDSIGDYDATPTFRGDSSDGDVSATLISFVPISSLTPPAIPPPGQWTPIKDAPDAPTGWIAGELDMTFWGAGLIQSFSDATDMPLAIPVFIYALGSALLLGLLAYRLSMGQHGRGSLLVQAIVSLLVMVYFVITGSGVVPAWILLPFGLEAIATIMWKQTINPW